MRDWIVGYEKGAAQKRPGVTEQEWADAEGTLGPAPEELRDLYHAFNGATFSSGVHLFPLRAEGPHRGLLEESRISVVGLPEDGVWRFGEKGSKHLFALSKGSAVNLENAPRPEWLESVDDSDWVYGVKDELTQVVKLHRNLETLLATLIPPAESEEFGERTYARAMTLVQSALDGLEEAGEETESNELVSSDAETTPAVARPAARKAPAKAKPAAKAKPKAKAKKAAPRKAAKAKSARKVAKKPARASAKKAAPKKAAKAKTQRKAKAKKPAAKRAAKPAKKAAKKAPKKAAKRGGRR